VILSEAKKKMLALLSEGTGILMSCSDYGLPTIHSVGNREEQALQTSTEVVHCGFGMFKAYSPLGRMSTNMVTFDGGGAMRRVDNDDRHLSWSPLYGDKSDIVAMGYDFEAAIEAVNAL